MELFKKVSGVLGAAVLAAGVTGAAYGVIGTGSGSSTEGGSDPCALLKPAPAPAPGPGGFTWANQNSPYLNCLTQAVAQGGQTDPCASLKPAPVKFGIGVQNLSPVGTMDAYVKCLLEATRPTTGGSTGANGGSSAANGGSSAASGGEVKAIPTGDTRGGSVSSPAPVSGGSVNVNVTNNNSNTNTNSNSNSNTNSNSQSQGNEQEPASENPVDVDEPPTPTPSSPPASDDDGAVQDHIAAP